MPIQAQPCGCRQAHQKNSGTAASALGFTSTTPPPTAGLNLDWRWIAGLALAALLIYALMRNTPKREAKRAARARYRASLERIERRYA